MAFTPAAIIIEAKVWRHSCRRIGESPFASQAIFARALSVLVQIGPPVLIGEMAVAGA